MKKGVYFVWDKAYQEAFEDIKEYLTRLPILVASLLGKLFFLYIKTMNHSLGLSLPKRMTKAMNKPFTI